MIKYLLYRVSSEPDHMDVNVVEEGWAMAES